MAALTDIGYIRELLARHGFQFSKALGQNFLVNPSVCPRMAEAAVSSPETGALEIGAGIGVLTYELAQRADKVVCVEVDDRLPPILAETLAGCDNAHIVLSDIMEVDLPPFMAEHFGNRPVAVCANLPYYITSPVIMKLLEDKLPITAITVMVQKEAAQRICAPVGSRESGAVTVSVNYYAEPSLQFHVSAGSFMPAPKVDSAVIRLDVRKEPPVITDEEKFFRVVKAAFSQRRKVISNSLSSGLKMSKDEINEVLAAANVPSNARAEKLSLDDFAAIAGNLRD